MSEEVIQYWEENAGRYREQAYKYQFGNSRYPFYETRLALIDDMTKSLPAGRLLDAGCGGGHHMRLVAPLAAEVVGVDLNCAALATELCREHEIGRASCRERV